MSDTPETDNEWAEIRQSFDGPIDYRWACDDLTEIMRRFERERDDARICLREMIGILEENIARRAGLVQPGGGNMHEAMLLAKWRKAANMDTKLTGGLPAKEG